MGIRNYFTPARTGVMMGGSKWGGHPKVPLAHRASLQGAVGHLGEGFGVPEAMPACTAGLGCRS